MVRAYPSHSTSRLRRANRLTQSISTLRMSCGEVVMASMAACSHDGRTAPTFGTMVVFLPVPMMRWPLWRMPRKSPRGFPASER